MPRSAWAVAAAGVAGQLASAAVGALPWPLLPVSVLLYVVAAALSTRAAGPWITRLRHLGSGLAVLAAVAVLPSLAQPPDPEQLKASLGVLLVATQVCQALQWQRTRDLRGGLFTAGGLLVLGASYAPDVLVGIPLLLGWVAVLVALAQLHGHRPVLPVTAVAVVLGLVAFLLVPVPVSAGLRSRFAGGAGADVPGRGSQGAQAFSGEELDLRSRGALGTVPVATVPADSPLLWRAAAFDQYDGTTWSRPPGGVLTGGPVYRVGAATGPTREDQVDLRRPTHGTVWSPGPLVSVRAGGIAGPRVNELGDVRLPGLRGRYTVTSAVPVTDPARLRARRGVDEPDPRFRALPTALPERVTRLAQEITADSTSRYDAAAAVARWLREHATYRLDSPVPGRDEDAVDRFLFVDRTGFCEQFASAQAVLLRAVGVPARLVTGLAYGRPDGADRRLYRASDLHAWVELWVPGAGWVSSDPTAGVPLADGAGGPGLRARTAQALTSGLRALTQVPGGRTGLALLLLAGTALVGGLVARRRPVPRPPAPVPAAGGGPALQAFLRLDARLGERGRRPGESLRELAGRLDPALAEPLAVVERECYAPEAPDPRPAVEVLDRY